jgi:hypothetical protein
VANTPRPWIPGTRISSPSIKNFLYVWGGAGTIVRSRSHLDGPVKAVGLTQHSQVTSAVDPFPKIGREVSHPTDVSQLQASVSELPGKQRVGHD